MIEVSLNEEYKFSPREAIPQIITKDKDSRVALIAIKAILEVRDGRSSQRLERFVTLGELEWSLSKLIPSETMIAKEDLAAGNFIKVFKDESIVKARNACSLDPATDEFIICNGYVNENFKTGTKATVFYSGINKKYSKIEELKTGSVVYLGEKPGTCTNEKLTLSQMLGFRIKSGILFLPGDIVKECSSPS